MKKISKKDTILLGVLVVVVIITVIVLMKPKRKAEAPATPLNKIFSADKESQSEQQLQLPPIDIFERGLESDQRFRKLKEFKVEVDKEIKIGKDNPFEPFNY